jgi:hypothetical protein
MITTDPLLGGLGYYGGFTPTVRLLPGSSAINAGSACPATDQRGVPRPQGGGCDIGAYEYGHELYFVKSNALGSNNGRSWTNAFKDLQSALAIATSGDTIWVAAGTYKPTIGTSHSQRRYRYRNQQRQFLSRCGGGRRRNEHGGPGWFHRHRRECEWQQRQWLR